MYTDVCIIWASLNDAKQEMSLNLELELLHPRCVLILHPLVQMTKVYAQSAATMTEDIYRSPRTHKVMVAI
jgi:hypothetical protein